MCFNSCKDKYWSQKDLRCVNDKQVDCGGSSASSGGNDRPVAIPIADDPIAQPVDVENGEPTAPSHTGASGTFCN